MSWDSLLAVLKADKESAKEQATKPPVDCPFDGEPLVVGKAGIRVCPRGDYRYP